MSSFLTAGWLKKSHHQACSKALKYIVRFLDESHLPVVMALQEVIVQHLQHPDLLQPFSFEFMKQHMGSRGLVLGVFVEHRLVAFRNIYYPYPWEGQWNLGLDLELEKEELTQVANLQMVCVHPDYRGNRLASVMNRISLGLLRERRTHRHVFATVSPYNIWNLPILLESGFRIAALKNKYGGKLRYIVYQDLHYQLPFDDNSATSVCLEDFDAQKKLLNAGFYGVTLSRKRIFAGKPSIFGYDLVFKTPRGQSAEVGIADPPTWWRTFPPDDVAGSIQPQRLGPVG